MATSPSDDYRPSNAIQSIMLCWRISIFPNHRTLLYLAAALCWQVVFWCDLTVVGHKGRPPRCTLTLTQVLIQRGCRFRRVARS
jgi:hypothetical protein